MRHIVRVVRRIIFAAMVIALLAPIVPVSVVHAANIQYVGTTADNAGTGTDCSQPLLVCTLRDALNAVASGGTIALPPGNVNMYAITLTHGSLTIAKNVTIQGGGLLTVNGGGAATVFAVNNGVSATISGLTIEHGNAGNDAGGGIHNSGTLTVAQSVIENNSAPTASGGGVYNLGALTLTDCIVRDNSSGGYGGGIGSGNFYSNTLLTITGSTISGNTATIGGGIFTALGGIAAITASTIQGNRATNGGGLASGIILNGNAALGSDVTISGSTVRDNQATGTGGGIYSNNGLTVTNSTVSGNQAGGNGGGLFNEPYYDYNSPNAALIATTVSNNTVNASGSSGGGIHNAPGAIATLTDALVAGNGAASGATAPDVANAFASGGHNLIGVGTGSTGIVNGTNGDLVGIASAPLDPRLGPLAANGGPTATHALLLNSLAIEAGGLCPSGVTQDQRGQPRINNCDIGAYEYQPVTPTLMDATGPASGGPVTFHGAGFQTGSRLILGSPFSATFDVPASAVSADGTSMTLDLPPGAAAGPVAGGMMVTNPGLPPSARATFTYLPVITGLSPSSGALAGGGSVTIRGAGFAAGVTSVTFGGTLATTVRVDSNTQITAVAPAHGAGAMDVTVTVSGMSVTKVGAYTYGTVSALPPPQQPGSGAGTAPNPLPVTRPPGMSAPGGSANPLPPAR